MSPATDSPVEFWFDFSSPYAFFASLDIEAIARKHKRHVVFRPFLLTSVFGRTGMDSLANQPLRGEYALHDWSRLAREKRVAFVLPRKFPFQSAQAARLFYAIEARNPAKAGLLAKGILQSSFELGADMSDPVQLAKVADGIGLSKDDLDMCFSDARAKQILSERNAEGLDRGIFGSPFFIVDAEPFWGCDRLPMMDRWLSSGGW